jgi:hypothetical protein
VNSSLHWNLAVVSVNLEIGRAVHVSRYRERVDKTDDERGDYLFEIVSFTVEFVVIQEGMGQLNEFRVLCQDSLLRMIANLRRELRSYREREKRLIFEDIGDGTDDAIMGLEDIEIPRWEDSERFLVRFHEKKP